MASTISALNSTRQAHSLHSECEILWYSFSFLSRSSQFLSSPLSYNTRSFVVSSKDLLGMPNKGNRNAMLVNQVKSKPGPKHQRSLSNDESEPNQLRTLVACRLTLRSSRSASSFRGFSSSTSSRPCLVHLLDLRYQSLDVDCHSCQRTTTRSRCCQCQHGPSRRRATADQAPRHQDVACCGCHCKKSRCEAASVYLQCL